MIAGIPTFEFVLYAAISSCIGSVTGVLFVVICMIVVSSYLSIRNASNKQPTVAGSQEGK